MHQQTPTKKKNKKKINQRQIWLHVLHATEHGRSDSSTRLSADGAALPPSPTSVQQGPQVTTSLGSEIQHLSSELPYLTHLTDPGLLCSSWTFPPALAFAIFLLQLKHKDQCQREYHNQQKGDDTGFTSSGEVLPLCIRNNCAFLPYKTRPYTAQAQLVAQLCSPGRSVRDVLLWAHTDMQAHYLFIYLF